MLTRRPAGPADDEFQAELFASTRTTELSGFDEAGRAAFVRLQVEARSAHHALAFPGATVEVLELDGEPVGRLQLADLVASVHIVDVALLPRIRGRGHGTTLLREVQAEAAARGRDVTLSADAASPALRLYTRLGFTSTVPPRRDDPAVPLRWSAPSTLRSTPCPV